MAHKHDNGQLVSFEEVLTVSIILMTGIFLSS